ncbi:CidA/LrgA family protein [Ruminococcus sp.]
MKWMKQFGIILLISFVGEILEKWIPLPIPASIYGIILLFLCLKLNIIPHEAVHETGKFLIEIMPLMFIPAAVGLLETWDVIAPAWLEYVAVTVISTWVVMIVSGGVTQFVIRRKRKDVQESHV